MGTKSFKLYFKGSLTSLLASALQKIAVLVIIWILNRVLSKGEFGNYSLAITIIGILTLVASAGLERTTMYRLSRLKLKSDDIGGKKFASCVFWWGLLISCGITFLLVLVSQQLSFLFNKPSIHIWLIAFAILIPLDVGRGIYNSWYRSRQRIVEAIFNNDIVFVVLKLILITLIWFMMPSISGVALAFVISSLVVLVLWFVKNPMHLSFPKGQLKKWDVQYGLKLMLNGLTSVGMRKIDLLCIGAIGLSGTLADYALASQLAWLLFFGYQSFNVVLYPRMGQFFAKNEHNKLRSEYDLIRILSLSSALIISLMFVFYGKYILQFFGDYVASYSVLLILIAAYIVTISFGTAAGFLNLAGHSGWLLLTSVCAVSGNILLNLYLVPLYGGNGAAIATLISMTLSSVMMTIIIFKLRKFKIYSLELFCMVCLMVVLLLVCAFGVFDYLKAGLGLMLILLYYLIRNRDLLLQMFKSFKEVFQ